MMQSRTALHDNRERHFRMKQMAVAQRAINSRDTALEEFQLDALAW
jgi:hypothetical protein